MGVGVGVGVGVGGDLEEHRREVVLTTRYEQMFDVAASFNIIFFRVSVSPFWTIIPSKDIGLLSHGAYCRSSYTVRAIPSLSKKIPSLSN